MNILLVGGNYLGNGFKTLGHTVFNVTFEQSADLIITHPFTWGSLQNRLEAAGFTPDLLLYIDNGNLPLLLDPFKAPIPSIYYSIDTYCNPWHVPYGETFDLAYVAQKDMLPLFKGQNAAWLPLFAQAALLNEVERERDLPLSFVGTLGHKNNPQREPFLKKVAELAPLKMLSGDFVPVFRRSKIVINQTAFGELNFRCFEAMALGAALLMENCGNGMAELFSPGVDILPVFTRNNAREAAEIAKIHLAHPHRLAEIARAGCDLVRLKHTDVARAKKIAADVANLTELTGRRLTDPERRKISAQTAFGMLAAELTGENMRAYRDFFLTLAR